MTTSFADRVAHSNYMRRVRSAQAAGTWQPWVDAAAAREHLLMLSAAGIGYRRVSELAGMSRSNLRAIRAGSGPRQIRPETEAKILAIRPTGALLARGSLVPAAGTVRRVQALAVLGWPRAVQARRLGMFPEYLYDLVGRAGQVEHRTHEAVRDLYDRLWMSGPPETTRPQKARATRARRHAQRHGWFGPLAWDDDTIDDPAALPCVLPPVRPPVPLCDELAIQHAAAGHTDPAGLDLPSRMEWIVRRMAGGGTAKGLSRELGCSDFTVTKLHRAALALNAGAEWPVAGAA